MKRFMTLMLALTFLGSTVAVAFAHDATGQTDAKKKKKKKTTMDPK
jgi:hypothetical protein